MTKVSVKDLESGEAVNKQDAALTEAHQSGMKRQLSNPNVAVTEVVKFRGCLQVTQD